MQAIWSGFQARAIDQLSSAQDEGAALLLMEEAGQHIFQKVLCLRRPFQKILILAGAGNNGGDALVVARLLHDAGFAPAVISVMTPGAKESPLRQLQRERCISQGLTLQPARLDFAGYSSATLVLDGVFGLGVQEPLRAGLAADLLAAVAHLHASIVLAIDLPSGLQADAWNQGAPPLPATHTLTFSAPKPAHVFAPARSFCGELTCVPLGFLPSAIDLARGAGPQLSCSSWEGPDPWRGLAADAHKYQRGQVLIVGGSVGKGGAPLLAAEGALRSGAGWVSVASLAARLRPERPPYFTYEDLGSELPLQAERLEALLAPRRLKALLIGPGMIKNPLSAPLLTLLARWNREEGLFLVFDAGALRGWSQLLGSQRFVPERTLLTPHPGEWLAIDPSHRPLDDMQALDAAWDFCERAGVSVFYKSSTPFSLFVQDGQRHLQLARAGDLRLAKAGSGDVLAGVATTLGAAGLAAGPAAACAQNLLGAAARHASRTWGRHGLSPLDMAASIGSMLDALPDTVTL